MNARQPLTVQAIIDKIFSSLNCEPIEKTMDTLKRGDPNAPVTGIATTFMASKEVLAKAQALSANLIITHEPTFYGHSDDAEWLQGESVYEGKEAFIKKHDLAIYRLHDYWHHTHPDGIVAGIAKRLGWESYQCESSGNDATTPAAWAQKAFLFNIPKMPLEALIDLLKDKLNIATIRAAGPRDMTCSKISLRVGSQNGRRHIRDFVDSEVDVVICGEVREWEACEYVRDANQAGKQIALLPIGHCTSEEAGMEYLVEHLTKLFPDIPSTYIPTGEPFWYR